LHCTSFTSIRSRPMFGTIPEVSRSAAPVTVSGPLDLNNAHDLVSDGVGFEGDGDGWGDGRRCHPSRLHENVARGRRERRTPAVRIRAVMTVARPALDGGKAHPAVPERLLRTLRRSPYAGPTLHAIAQTERTATDHEGSCEEVSNGE